MIQLVILVMWNRRVVERLEGMVGSYSVSTRRERKMGLIGLVRGCMDQTMIAGEVYFGMS